MYEDFIIDADIYNSELPSDTEDVTETAEDIACDGEIDEFPEDTETVCDAAQSDSSPDEFPEDSVCDTETLIEEDDLTSPDELTDEEKKHLDYLRQKAVKDAWLNERDLVLEGKGTRDWSVAQQIELIETGKVTGFEGQHMLSVKDNPEYAGNPDNIQFLTYEEHFYGAHDGNFKNPTEGRFVPETGAFEECSSEGLPSRPIIDLTDKCDSSQIDMLSEWDSNFGYNRKADYQDSKERYKDIKSNKKFLKEE